MTDKKFIVSHAPFWHDGGHIANRSCHTIFAALPAVVAGVIQYGIPALGVISLSVSTAMIWEYLLNLATRRAVSIGDGNAALIGLLFGMLLPATAPWWLVVIGTFMAILVGKQIYGGIGGNPFNPVLVAIAICMLSWKNFFDFDEALVNYEFGFAAAYPLAALKYFGVAAVEDFGIGRLLFGKQIGGIGATFGIGLIAGGVYLMIRGFIRWEISLSYLAGIFVTALIFHLVNPAKYGGPFFHLLAGYTLIVAFFLAPEDSSSPVNMIPMFLYGIGAGVTTMIIRNIGSFVDGAVFAVLLFNIANPLLDRIRPKALGKVGNHA
jgi:electron transport complex protein RnfD